MNNENKRRSDCQKKVMGLFYFGNTNSGRCVAKLQGCFIKTIKGTSTSQAPCHARHTRTVEPKHMRLARTSGWAKRHVHVSGNGPSGRI